TCADKIDDLPEATEAVLADSGYDANALAERVEYDAQQKRTGRRFLCPENPRNNKRPKKKPCKADASRARRRERRRQRKKFLKSRRGSRLYARRKKTVEPFNHGSSRCSNWKDARVASRSRKQSHPTAGGDLCLPTLSSLQLRPWQQKRTSTVADG